MSRAIQQLADDFERTGHHPFHLPVGIDLNESDPEAGRCVRCNRFDGFPCLTDGKADAHVRCVRPALAHDNVTLLTHAKVERLETDSSGDSVKRVDRRPARRARGLQRRHRRRLMRRDQLGGAAAADPPATSTRAVWRTPPTSSAATTWRTSTRA